MKFKRYHALGPDGLANIGTKLDNGDIYIHKYSPVFDEDYK